jgi:hypothetical protein
MSKRFPRSPYVVKAIALHLHELSEKVEQWQSNLPGRLARVERYKLSRDIKTEAFDSCAPPPPLFPLPSSFPEAPSRPFFDHSISNAGLPGDDIVILWLCTSNTSDRIILSIHTHHRTNTPWG